MSNLLTIRKVNPLIIEKGWGHEEVIVNDEVNGYCGKLLVFNQKGYRGSLHFHINKHEHFRVGAGKFQIQCVDPKDASEFTFDLVEGDIIEIPRGHSHRIVCVEAGYIIEFSTPDDYRDSYRVAKGDSQK